MTSPPESSSGTTTSITNNVAVGGRKRKADAIGRVTESSSIGGRGALVGWVHCPLCGRHSQKKYALGRGIANHLVAVHTPWKPGKIERNIRRRERERRRHEQNAKTGTTTQETRMRATTNPEQPDNWEPTPQEQNEWEEKIIQILKELEEEYQRTTTEPTHVDRNGQQAQSYQQSLPPFIHAAANGDIQTIHKMLQEASEQGTLQELLDTRDRHLSVADHWAAGSGHLDCLKLLFQYRHEINTGNDAESLQPRPKKARRRDGKTCLHYAARNGQLHCLKYLLEEDKSIPIDTPSGDGTTPLHLAVYGGHADAVRYLVQQGADPQRPNEWGCTSAHWLAMCRSRNATTCIPIISDYLCSLGVSMTSVQKQGHSPLHKAAQNKNRHFFEWILGDSTPILNVDLINAIQPDQGGHTPLDIWEASKGDVAMVSWIKERFDEILADPGSPSR